ncbi:MAG: YfcC family protein [Firmicutes bacterium]|nr:YfcC family protein [Bacillota bacterium]
MENKSCEVFIMKKFKMPSAFTILFIIIFLVAILTWFVPAGEYKYVDEAASVLEPIPGTYERIESNPQGLWEALSAPIQGFFDAVDIILFLLVIGGFLGLVTDTGAIGAGIGAVVSGFRGRETLMIPILMSIFALGGTVFGMWEETIAFYVIIIPVFIAAGFDALTGFAVIALGAGIGCLGSTVNPFATGIASGFAGISIGEGILLRVVLLLAGLGISIWYVMSYARKVKADPSKSYVYRLKEENEKHFLAQSMAAGDDDSAYTGGKSETIEPMSGRQKAILWVFGLSFLIMVLGVIPWADKFGITIFEDFNIWFKSLPFIGTLFGNVTPLGEWWFGDITVWFLIASLICWAIWGWEEMKFVALFIEGAKDLLSVALIIGVTRGISVIMNDGGLTATLLHFGEEALQSLGAVAFTDLSAAFFAALSFLVPSTSGMAALAMPVMAPIADFVGVGRDLVITAFQVGSGLVNFITPTSGVLMGALALARVPYGTYLKWVWKFIVILTIVCLVILSVAALL